jgi:hypothetical protein
MSKHRKLSLLILLILLAIIFTVFIKRYEISLVLFGALIVAFRYFRLEVAKELVVAWLCKHDYQADYDQLLEAFPKTGKQSIGRLVKKGIVKNIGNRIILIRHERESVAKNSSKDWDKDIGVLH